MAVSRSGIQFGARLLSSRLRGISRSSTICFWFKTTGSFRSAFGSWMSFSGDLFSP